MKQKNKNQAKWFLVGLLSILLAAPNASILKYTLGSTDPITFNLLRYGLIAFLTLPFIIAKGRGISRKGLRQSVAVGVCMAAAVFSYTAAIKLSQASYVSVVTLITPIVFILYSTFFMKEKITHRSIAGITLAALGAFVVVFLPLALHQGNSFQFYPLATLLSLINSLTFPLAIIFSKKAHEDGTPMMAVFGVSSWVVTLIFLAAFCMAGKSLNTIGSIPWLGVAYSGIMVALVSRVLGVASYERVGSVVNSALGYLETLLAILISVIALGEKISEELVIGGALILLGVYVVEHHKSAYHKHFHFHRNH